MLALEKLYNRLKSVQKIDIKIVTDLYALSEKSLLALFILVLFLTIFFYPSLPVTMFIWSVSLFTIVFLRLFFAIQFRKNSERVAV